MNRFCKIVIYLHLFIGCTNNNQRNQVSDFDIGEFKNIDKSFILALAKEDTTIIEKFIRTNSGLVKARESSLGRTFLHWCVKNNKVGSAKKLLEFGSDPNLQDFYDGTSPLMLASGYGKNFDTSSQMLKLLLRFGGNPNSIQLVKRRENTTTRKTPLIIAAGCCLNKTKILVDAGALINFKNEFQESPLESALMSGSDAAIVTKYLVIEKKARFLDTIRILPQGNVLTILDYLRNWTFPLNSNDYKIKKEIISFLNDSYNLNYRNSKIPRQLIGKYEQDYLDKY